MKKEKAVIAVCLVLLALACGVTLLLTDRPAREEPAPSEPPPVSAAPTPSAAPQELTEEERQLDLLVRLRDVWIETDPVNNGWFYAVTDLDQNGQLELITSVDRGTSHVTTTAIWEVAPDLRTLLPLGTETSCDSSVLERLAQGGPVPCGALLLPLSYDPATRGEPQFYPVFYDAGQDVYHYCFTDECGSWPEILTVKRSFALKDGAVTGVLLGYQLLVGIANPTYNVRDTLIGYWDAYGNYVNQDAYDTALERWYQDSDTVEQRQAAIAWLAGRPAAELNDGALFDLLKRSWERFAVT